MKLTELILSFDNDSISIIAPDKVWLKFVNVVWENEQVLFGDYELVQKIDSRDEDSCRVDCLIRSSESYMAKIPMVFVWFMFRSWLDVMVDLLRPSSIMLVPFEFELSIVTEFI